MPAGAMALAPPLADLDMLAEHLAEVMGQYLGASDDEGDLVDDGTAGEGLPEDPVHVVAAEAPHPRLVPRHWLQSAEADDLDAFTQVKEGIDGVVSRAREATVNALLTLDTHAGQPAKDKQVSLISHQGEVFLCGGKM